MIPRYYQWAANSFTWSYLAERSGNPLIVLPTGAGKSLVIAMLCKQAIEFGGRVVVLAHRKELISQNALELQELMPEIKVGIYSAGLKSRNTTQSVVIGGIQSIYGKASELGPRHLIIVDEAHLISDKEESMYQTFLIDIAGLNPASRVVGLTATPYRTSEGPLCGKDKLFQKICYEVQTADLIEQGFLCPITNKPTLAEVDTSKLAIRGGEVVESEAQRLFDTTDNIEDACEEIIDKCHDRKSVLIFSSGVAHAEHIAEQLAKRTRERVGVITGETLPLERSALISDFKEQRLRWLCNCDVLTTGFNAKCVDAIAVLRTTMSPGLFAQMIGRGLRKHESKENCLVLDFGQNIKRHGSIDDPNYGRASSVRQGSGKDTVAAANNGRGKPCPNCNLDVAANSRECGDCGFVFPVKHEGTSDDSSQLTGKPEPETWIVTHCSYKRHDKKGDPDAPPTLRVDYDCANEKSVSLEAVRPQIECKYSCGGLVGTLRENGPHIELICADCERHQKFVSKKEVAELSGTLMKTMISEYVCLEHSGYARTKAGLWWQARSECMEPDRVDDAVKLLRMGVARVPVKITTVKDGKWYRIQSAEFDCERPTELPEQEEVKVYSGMDEDVPF